MARGRRLCSLWRCGAEPDVAKSYLAAGPGTGLFPNTANHSEVVNVLSSSRGGGTGREVMVLMESHAHGGDRRSPGAEKLTYVLSVRLSQSQRDALRAAAKRAGMARSAWVGELLADAIEHRALPIGWLQREVVQELIRLRRDFTMAVASLNQIALALSSEDAISSDLETVIGHLRDLISRAERVTETVRRRM